MINRYRRAERQCIISTTDIGVYRRVDERTHGEIGMYEVTPHSTLCLRFRLLPPYS